MTTPTTMAIPLMMDVSMDREMGCYEDLRAARKPNLEVAQEENSLPTSQPPTYERVR